MMALDSLVYQCLNNWNFDFFIMVYTFLTSFYAMVLATNLYHLEYFQFLIIRPSQQHHYLHLLILVIFHKNSLNFYWVGYLFYEYLGTYYALRPNSLFPSYYYMNKILNSKDLVWNNSWSCCCQNSHRWLYFFKVFSIISSFTTILYFDGFWRVEN